MSTLMAFYGQKPTEVMLWRIGLGSAIILITVICLAWSRRKHFLNPQPLQSPRFMSCKAILQSMSNKAIQLPFTRFVAQGTHSFLSILPYLLIGCALAAVFNTSVDRESTQHIFTHPTLAPLGSILLAQLLCLCSTTDAFIITGFFSLSLPAKLAFLIAGPLMDIRLFILYTSLFTVRFTAILWFTITMLTWIFIVIFSPIIQ
jgi:uncharacterized membrane protein YraQ (UPF0718 family)